ncbi:mpv17-like protein 2 [Venturia canescens]|uniref:mpv17-like protein 2 n=1 Tax=Venturia canescens TaxID=32260 RepID=UPI001C9D2926|nr:mpv17-like protein 2 [Venturia canescens]XP_043289210.1 mpv17-like protein 2 [Venturia canescens]
MNIARGMGLFVTRVNVIKEQLFSPKNLFYTNVGISISLSAVGDILEQHYEILKGEWERWCPNRTRNMAISGMSVGIICHHWYRYLDKRLPGRTIGIVVKKVVIDQLVCSPLCIAMFFITLGILEKSNWSELKEEIREKAHRLYIAEWVVWPPAQLINFYILPTKYRVLYDNTISLGYDVYTSQVKHDKPRSVI